MRIERIFEWTGGGTPPDAAAPAGATVWRVALDADADELARAGALLSSEERARADRFAFAVHRRRFVAARAALREILGSQLAVGPREVEFHYTGEGKPRLRDRADWHFSVSHSQELCMIAVSRDSRIGIDVEATAARARMIQAEEVTHALHPAEQEALAALGREARQAAFYRCWVRKEALLKALGVGLAGGLDRFAVSIGNEARLIGSDPALADASGWTLVALDGEDYAAALAIECGAAKPRPLVRKPRCRSSGSRTW
ncbi:MAG TPA: 4'-phosphopantetheinyl transferase superfamily protein [Ramlibacter sp.]|uniref:4'-phosphopantetheinyl transferase family protein n=1 Tax=Ramlibacter sp. TaxID=1917967 RepID=UPI002BC50F74|nr:4'-phosphopantetheinyl transferase superfamily protein [Ramlibacter sp.]HVZ44388.1 4'-phosphopantetheinyl transferase superfamily protein [Ramlibacter sp.]